MTKRATVGPFGPDDPSAAVAGRGAGWRGWRQHLRGHGAAGSSATAGHDAASIARIRQAIAGFPVVTCDIFDTALMRRLARPEDVHLLTGVRAAAAGLLHCPAAAFRDYRIAAEAAARADLPPDADDEVALATVYARLHDAGVVRDAAHAAAVEFAAEQAVCRAVPAVHAALAARAAGQRLLFLSDTMLPGDWLAMLLRGCGYGDAPAVLCSADAHCTKSRGGLFARALEQLGCAARDVVHLGDNPQADIAQARRNGIATLHLPAPRMHPEPAWLARQDTMVRLTHSMRRARCTPPPATCGTGGGDSVPAVDAPLPPHLQRIVLLPLIGFTLFVLAEARRRGIDRIYFTARDGYLPLAIARRLLAGRNNAPALHYLEGSRQALLLPSLQHDLPRLAVLLAESGGGRALRDALQPLGIDAAGAAAMARQAGCDPDLLLRGKAAIGTVRALLAANAAAIGDALATRHAGAVAYLRQSGFLQPGPRMIVDVGWRGSVQQALTRLSGAPPEHVVGCYLGLWPEALSPALGLHNAAGYLFSFGHPKPALDIVRQGYILLELFFSAPHGPLSHYALRDAEAVPVHAVEAEPAGSIRRAAVQAIAGACLAEFDALHDLLDGAWPDAIDPAAALHEMAKLLTRPGKRDVAAINRVPFVHGMDGSTSGPAVNPMPWHGLLRDLPRALARLETSPWQGGSLRAALPWPVPDIGFPEFRHRAQQLRRLLHLS
jgi:FMN phosphatase YigB (HAD superfamily)